MKSDLSKDLIPSKSEMKEIIAQMMQTTPTQIPVVLLQYEFARFMLKAIDRLRSDLNESIKHLEDEIDQQ